MKKRTEQIIRERKRGYLDYQVQKAEERGGLGNCFEAPTKPVQSVDKTPNFDVKSVCTPGSSDLAPTEECTDYFSAISNKFVPLDMANLPETFSLPLLHIDQCAISRRLQSFKKPRSMFLGDIFPQLVSNMPWSWPNPWRTSIGRSLPPLIWKKRLCYDHSKVCQPRGPWQDAVS